MNIYIILPNLSAGGAERVVVTMARILHKQGNKVEFLNLGQTQGEMLSWIKPEFKLTSFECDRVLSAFLKLRIFMKVHNKGVFFSSREHVNVIGLLAAKFVGCKMVVRIPNMPKNVLVKGVSGYKMRIIKVINQWLLKSAKMIIAQNSEMRNQILDYYSLPIDKVVAIYNPVDKDYVLASADGYINPFKEVEFNFLNVCNIAYSKGIDILMEAWPSVKKAIPTAHMYVLGRNTGDYASELMKKAENLRDFTFLGFKNNPYPYIKYCDCFVLPSRMEGFPNVVLEAMCFNRPVACTTCVDVIKTIITEGKNGYYCDIENADALADCMVKAVQIKNIENEYNLFDKELLINSFK